MDTPVKIIVATMVLLIVAAIILSMFSSQTGPLSDFVTGEREGASCQIGKAKFDSVCDCSGNSGDEAGGSKTTDEANRIWEKYHSNGRDCSWGASGERYYCKDACS